MKSKPIVNNFCERVLVSGNKIRFWEDVWHYKASLADTFLDYMTYPLRKTPLFIKLYLLMGDVWFLRGGCGVI
jgi:hypothetical protein